LHKRLAPVAFLLAAVASACGGSSEPATGPAQPAAVASITVSLASPAIGAGRTTAATAVLRDASGTVLTGRAVNWTSSAASVATVSAAGVVAAVAPGTASITATSEGKTGSAAVTVSANPVATVTVTLANADLTQGSSTQAVAMIRDAGGNLLVGRTITWSSAATAVASVSSSGLVTAVGPGAVLITDTSEGVSGSAAVTVTGVAVASVTVNLSPPYVGVGGISQAGAVLTDAGGLVLSGRSVVWTSSSPGVATVSASGVVTGVGLGSSTITAVSEGLSGSATVTVAALYPVTSLSQTAPPSSAVVQPPAVRVTDARGNPLEGIPVTFAVTAGGGTVTGSPATTNASGVARLSSWTFGPAGGQSVRASAASIPGVTVDFGGLARPASTGYDITLRLLTPMSDSQLRAFVDAKERIQEFVVGEIADQAVNLSAPVMTVNCDINIALDETVDDVLIYASVTNLDGVGKILAQAGFCVLRPAAGFPVVGVMQFDSSDIGSLEAGGAFEATVLHEMMHVLGFGTMWPDKGLLAGASTTLPYFTGPAARAAFVTHNGGGTYPGSPVPVEGSTGQPGTDYSHWREADFDDEIMTGFLDRNVPELVSATTVASMQDLGYVVDVTRADPYRWGASTTALRATTLQAGEPRFQMLDDVRRTPPIVLGPDGRPLFP
jgi:hypothetical protein